MRATHTASGAAEVVAPSTPDARADPPRSLVQLRQRALALAGRTLVELETLLEADHSAPMLHRKGKTGQLIERALGASAGSLSRPDFVGLGVELKTIPVDTQGRPRESTFVCSFAVADAERAEWSSSSVRGKLAHVLFMPVVYPDSTRDDRRARLGSPLFWRPSVEQEAVLRADFDDLLGLIAIGGIEALTAKLGLWLQVRPKAAHGGVRTRAYGADGEYLETIPRGFYLRARFTGALLRDPRALPGVAP
jgi:DNA mismatch repair protein MutH